MIIFYKVQFYLQKQTITMKFSEKIALFMKF